MSSGLVRVESMIITDQSLTSPRPSGTGQDGSGPFADSYVINWWSGDLSVKDWSVMISDESMMISDESRTSQ